MKTYRVQCKMQQKLQSIHKVPWLVRRLVRRLVPRLKPQLANQAITLALSLNLWFTWLVHDYLSCPLQSSLKVVCLSQVSRLSSSVKCQACPPGQVASLSALVKSVGCSLQSSLEIVGFGQGSSLSASVKVSSLSTLVKFWGCPL